MVGGSGRLENNVDTAFLTASGPVNHSINLIFKTQKKFKKLYLLTILYHMWINIKHYRQLPDLKVVLVLVNDIQMLEYLYQE